MGSPGVRPLAAVTGASSGIGYELARTFASNGFDLVVAADDARIVEAAQDFEALGAAVVPVQVDLTTYDGVERLYDRIRAAGRPLAAVAINAGAGVDGDFVRQTDLADDLRVVALNVTSSVHLAKLTLQDMVAAGEGRVLFTASVAATMPGPYYAVYAASKAFVHSFAQAVRYELRDTGVTVTSLMPGPTDTEFFERADMTDTRAATGHKDDPSEVARDGFEAMMAGKDHVVAGAFRNKVQAAAAHVTPAQVAAKMHARMVEPGGGERDR